MSPLLLIIFIPLFVGGVAFVALLFAAATAGSGDAFEDARRRGRRPPRRCFCESRRRGNRPPVRRKPRPIGSRARARA